MTCVHVNFVCTIWWTNLTIISLCCKKKLYKWEPEGTNTTHNQETGHKLMHLQVRTNQYYFQPQRINEQQTTPRCNMPKSPLITLVFQNTKKSNILRISGLLLCLKMLQTLQNNLVHTTFEIMPPHTHTPKKPHFYIPIDCSNPWFLRHTSMLLFKTRY